MNAKRERKALWCAVVGSFLVHVVVGLSLAWFNTAFAPVPVEEDKPVELTIMDLTPVAPPAVPKSTPFTFTEEDSAEKPKDATFESNANSIAASRLPATGDAPLPSQEGKDRPVMDLSTHDYSLPSQAAQNQPPVPSPPPPMATPAPSTPAPTPKATPLASATPEPMATPEPEQFAMLKSTPPPAIREPEEVTPTPAPEVAPTPPPPTARPMPERPASDFQAQKQETKITGRISNRGTRSAVDAVGTPLGKYQKQVYNAIGARWYYYMGERIDLISVGAARVVAEVDAKGKVQNLRIVTNSGNEAFANICLQSFQEAQIPPIPPELIPTLPEGRMLVEINFTAFPN